MSTTLIIAGLIAVLGFVAAIMTRAGDKRRSIERRLNSISNFSAAVSSIQATLTSAIAIDPERRRLVILRAPGGPESQWQMPIYSFDELIAVELVKDDIVITRTQRGSQFAGAAIGGVLLGPAGFVVGGLSGSKVQDTMLTKLALKIYVNDLLIPLQQIVFVDAPAGGLPPAIIQSAIHEAELWHGRLKAILERPATSSPARSAS